MNKYLYTTLVASDDYVKGAIGLHYSLQKTKTKIPFLVLITNNCSKNSIQLLEQYNINYLIVPLLTFQSSQIYRERYLYTLSKFYILQLSDYDKIAFLDADIFVFQNLDHFFDMPEENTFFYRVDAIDQDPILLFSGAYFIITPNKQIFDTAIKIGLNPNNKFNEDECLWTFLYPHKNYYFESQVQNIYFRHYRSKNKYWINKNIPEIFDYINENVISTNFPQSIIRTIDIIKKS